MAKYLRSLSCLLILLSGIFYANNSVAIEVESSNPEPNYSLTKSANDLVELTDGVIHKFPAWINKESVGWKAASAIFLEINLGLSEHQICDSGKLEIYSGKNEGAGVTLPRKVDVYQNNKHVKSININNEKLKNRQTHSISIPLKNIGNNLALVMHANGKYTMIDEITWSSDSQDCQSNIKHKENNIKTILVDSKQRLIDQLTAKVTPAPDPDKKLAVWFADPWGTLPTHSPEPAERALNERLVLKGFNNTREVFVVGIAGGCDQSQSYKIKLLSSPEIQKNIKMFEIKKQLVLDGSMVFDPLIPIQGERLACSDVWNTYLWFSIDVEQKFHSEKIIVEIQTEKKDVKTVEIDLKIANLEQSDECKLNVVNWAYPKDKPVWDTKTDLYLDLFNHGVNVFVIPQSFLKLPTSEDEAHIINKKGILNQIKNIRKYNDDVTILFFMAIHRWLDNNQQLTEMQREKIVIDWVKDFDKFLRSEGYTRDQWMLYPVDEPAAKKLEQLLWTVDAIKKASPETRIYANPIKLHKNNITYGQLKRLENDIDILQPSIELVQDKKMFFQNLGKPWWFYDSPPYPAKKAEPYFYRALPLKAWGLGASGTGFWSYSNTSKSSAWDDFDGRIADWAVVYEGKESIVSSRRWEAFAQGMSDYRFLCSSNSLNNKEVQMNNDRFNVKLKKKLDKPKTLVDLLIENKNYINEFLQ